MLGELEAKGARILLDLFPEQDLLALLKTVTNNQVVATSKHEAIQALVTFSNTPVELLKRKKLKRNMLFRYLVQEKIGIDPNADKLTLSKAILNHWGTKNFDVLDLMDVDDEEGATSSTTSCQTSTSQFSTTGVGPLPDLQLSTLPQSTAAAFSGTTPQPPPPTAYPQPIAAGESWLAEFMTFDPTVQQLPDDQEMGREFSRWFYQMLNSCHPNQRQPQQAFGPQHFFSDCTLKVLVLPSNDMDIVEGADLVSERYLRFVMEEGLLFNANVDAGGFMVRSTPHGLKIILTCGTLHRGDQLVGVFAQQFGLVRNPEKEFSWNVKFANLKLLAGSPTQTPTLQSPGNIQALM